MAIKNIDIIEKTLGLETGTLSTALKDEKEVEITLPELIVRTKEDQEKYEKNLRDSEYKNGKKAGEEMLLKEARERFELQFEGKTLDNFAEAFKTKIIEESKIEPNKKIDELKADNQLLKNNLKDWETKYQTLSETITKEKTEAEISSEILSAIPDNVILPKKDIEILFKTNYSVLIEDGKKVIKKDGEVLKDTKTADPMDLKTVVNDFITERQFAKKVEGRGDGDDNGKDKPGSYDVFVKEMKEKGYSERSADFQKEMSKRMKDGTLKI